MRFSCSKELQTKIFKLFFRTKGRGEGSGLGLHTVQLNIEKHKGTISLESEPSRTVFSIRLHVQANLA
ncbi:ATP-binding protein [Leptospira ognonensis]|uniref:ATP-binding protein n=1 Tax=Leptospira ognonensis TaxID=2484945 RepID=UPI00319DBDDA